MILYKKSENSSIWLSSNFTYSDCPRFLKYDVKFSISTFVFPKTLVSRGCPSIVVPGRQCSVGRKKSRLVWCIKWPTGSVLRYFPSLSNVPLGRKVEVKKLTWRLLPSSGKIYWTKNFTYLFQIHQRKFQCYELQLQCAKLLKNRENA